MPYIKHELRELINDGQIPQNVGELNYAFTSIIKAYMAGKRLDYGFLNGIVGALESAKLEFYRRVVVPYEDVKIRENGDVY